MNYNSNLLIISSGCHVGCHVGCHNGRHAVMMDE